MQVSTRALAWLAAVTWGLTVAVLATDGSRHRTGRERRVRSVDRVALSALSDSISRLGVRVRTEEVRRRVDSALAAEPGNSSGTVIVLGSGSAAALAPRADSQVRSLGFPARPRVPVHLALVEGPTLARVPIGFLQSFTLLPSLSEDRGCVGVRIVMPGEVDGENGREGRQRLPLGGALGPCWYLATFGEPGPHVRAWLDSRYWDVAAAIPPAHDRYEHAGETDNPPQLLYRLFAPVLTAFNAQSATQAGCAGEKPQLCEEVFLAPLPSGILADGIVGSAGLGGSLRASRVWTIGLPGSAQRSLLARMVDNLGTERFAEFWASDAPVAEAFRATAGEPLGAWYGEQLRAELREAGQPEPLGQPVWPSALGFLALALGGSLWFAGRRQVR